MGGNLQGRGKILHSYVYDLVGVFFLLLFVMILSVGEGTVQLPSSVNLPNVIF